ncbi:hypothetical protein N8955_01405 [bacterium]|nr:hypothetical protein [bacterium]MDA9225194.1 hypothetical protein [bacterium]
MNFNEITNPFVTRILVEGKDGKNTHLEHLEDNIFNKGHAGAKEAIDYLFSLHDMLDGNTKTPVSMTTKWDGAPALVCGKDPQSGKFFVGTKGVFAKKPKMNFTLNDIKLNHPGQDDLQNKLALALNKLSKLSWNTVAQGDFLFAKDTLSEQEIDGESYLTFKPNTLVYAVPSQSKLASDIVKSDIGIVWHTEYVGGPTLADTTAKFGFDSDVLGQASGVWHRDAIIKDLSGTVTFTAQESADIMQTINVANEYLKGIDAGTFKWLQQGTDLVGASFLQQLKAHANNQVRQGHFDEPTKFAQDFVQKFITYWTKEIEKVKTQKSIDAKTETMVSGVRFIKENLSAIISVYDLYLKLIESKVKIVRKLEQIRVMNTFVPTENGYEVTGEEGFVAVDRMGNALKLVDRLEFSRLNFGTGKPTG